MVPKISQDTWILLKGFEFIREEIPTYVPGHPLCWQTNKANAEAFPFSCFQMPLLFKTSPDSRASFYPQGLTGETNNVRGDHL